MLFEYMIYNHLGKKQKIGTDMQSRNLTRHIAAGGGDMSLRFFTSLVYGLI